MGVMQRPRNQGKTVRGQQVCPFRNAAGGPEERLMIIEFVIIYFKNTKYQSPFVEFIIKAKECRKDLMIR